MRETDEDILKKVRASQSWRQNARFERMGIHRDLLNNIKSALNWLGYNKSLMPLEYEQTAGRLLNLIRAERAKKAGRTRRARSRARKQALAQLKLF